MDCELGCIVTRKSLHGTRHLPSGNLGAIAGLLFLVVPVLYGQSSFGTIEGRVNDQSGAVLPTALVTLQNEGTNVSKTRKTNGAGNYVVPNLIPGSHAVRVTSSAFKIHSITHVRLTVEEIVDVDRISEAPRSFTLRREFVEAVAFASSGDFLSFLVFNRAKRSTTLDLKDPRGKAVALRIIKSSDVLVENFRPGVVDRPALGYEALEKVHPKLIY